MKFCSSVAALAATIFPTNTHAYSSHWEAEFYESESKGHTSNAMWVFSQDGVHIYSPSGEEKLVRHDKSSVCHSILDPWEPGVVQDECWAMDPVHDGENYVFVGNNNWVEDGFVDVFSMWTGRKLASIPVCSLPYHMEYSPQRREVWVSCWLRPAEYNQSNKTDTGTIEVIQTQALGAIPTAIDTRGVARHVHNSFVMDGSMPDQAYEFSMEDDTIYEIDAGSKTVREAIRIPLTTGTYETAYSPVNRHIYIRTYGCCACGIDKDTRQECADWMPDYPNVVEFGPNAGPDPQPGNCGKGCRGSLADVNGLWEFDTQTNTRVARHFPANDAHGAKPFASPLGDYVLIGSGDGGNAVKVLRPGDNGEPSLDVGVVHLDFGADVGTHAFSDVSFVDRNVAIFTSTLNNHVVIVDLTDFAKATATDPVAVHGVDLELFAEKRDEISIGHDARGINVRQILWATGTNYVWVSSPATAQVHVLELGLSPKDARVVRTLDDIDNTRHFLWVHNFEQDARMKDHSTEHHDGELQLEASSLVTDRIEDLDDDNSKATTLAIVGVVLGALALLVSIFNAVTAKNKPPSPTTQSVAENSITSVA